MVTFKLVIGTKNGQCVQKEVTDDTAQVLVGKTLGSTVSGDEIGLAGYEFTITGGSDFCGFPMRKEVPGTRRKKIFATKGVGLKNQGKGVRVRKTVCGNTIHDKITQINLKVTKEGPSPLVEPAAQPGNEGNGQNGNEEAKA